MAATKKRYVGIANPWVTQSDSSTITVDVSTANSFFITLTNNRTMGTPSNPTHGQTIDFRIKQDGTGSRTLTWNSVFKFSTGLPTPTLTTTANKTDYFRFIYDETGSHAWYCIMIVQGLT